MHIETIQGSGTSYRQALLRFTSTPVSNSWWRTYARRIAAIVDLDEITTAYRLNVRPDGGINRTFAAVFQPSSESAMRRFFGGFSLLEGYARDSVDFPDAASEFENWATDFPPLRCSVTPNPLQSGNVWFASDFRAGIHLDALVGDAQALGFGFGYQAHFRPFTPSIDRQRRIGYNLIGLQSLGRVPYDLLADQERQVRRFRSATLLVEEIVATDGEEAARWLKSALTRLFRANPVGARADAPSFEFLGGDADCSLMMHSTLLYGDWTDDQLVCSQSDQEEFRASVLGYRPPAAAAPRTGPSAASDADPPPPPFPPGIALPKTFSGPGHIFISYKRTDLPRIIGIMGRLVDQGLPIWYDRDLDVGDEWDVELERMINEAGLVLFFMSQSAANSKYCKREIRLANAVEKPILTIVLEQVDLPYGLKFLSLLQQINVNEREFDLLISKGIRKQLAAAGISP